MRANTRLLSLPHRHFRHSLPIPFPVIRPSLFSYRNFQSCVGVRQQAFAKEDEEYRPRRYDSAGSTIRRSDDADGYRYSNRRGGSSSRGRDFDRSGRGPRRDVDRGRDTPRYEIKSFTDEEGNRVELRNDEASLLSRESISEEVQIAAADVEVKENEISGYQPVKWMEYQYKIDPGFIKSMKNIFRYTHLTEVQNTIISRMPLNRDLLVRSKTGTGKTIAFLVPAIQRYIDYMKENELNPRVYSKTNTGVLIVVPTRELAIQVATEARRLVFEIEPSGMKVNVLVGGDARRTQIRRMDRERNDIIVATPGRLLDFLQSEPGVKNMLMSIKTLVLDETDTLLDMGFKKQMQDLLHELAPTSEQRLTMMYSATVSREVKALASSAVRRDVEFVNTVKPTDLDVHQTIAQTHIIRDMGDHLKIILSLIIKEQLEKPLGKIIVFFNATKQVQMYTLMFRILRKLYPNVSFQQFEIHSKKEQDARAKISHAFRTANTGAVLFTSDVSARGVDYPGVTKVIQVGAPSSRDIYIHRIGRTGRAGKLGEAHLILAPFEQGFLKQLKDIPIKDHELPESELELGKREEKVFKVAQDVIPEGMLEETYVSLLSYYLRRLSDFGVSAPRIQSEFENWALAMGASSPPYISENFLDRAVGKRTRMGMSGYGGRGNSNDRSRGDRGGSFNAGRGRFDRGSQGRYDSDRRGGGQGRGGDNSEGSGGYGREFTDHGRSDKPHWMGRGRGR